jgi:hypothetical protein
MSWIRGIGFAVLISVLASFGATAGSSGNGIDAFNKRYVEMHLKMDSAGIFRTWAEDGAGAAPGSEWGVER